MAAPRILLLTTLALLAGCVAAPEPEPRSAPAPQGVAPRLREAVSVKVWARG